MAKELVASICPKGGSSRFVRNSGKDWGLLQCQNCKLTFLYIHAVRIRKGPGSLLFLHEALVAIVFTRSVTAHSVNYKFSSDSRDRSVTERLSYGMDDQKSVPDTGGMFFFSAERQTRPSACQGIQRLRRRADHYLQLLPRVVSAWRCISIAPHVYDSWLGA